MPDKPADTEHIVLLDEALRPIGSAPKLESHHENTPLHLAFSCYLFNDKGELLVTQRAHTKKVWPAVWTNSFCGHPAPGELTEDAIRRRAIYELGIHDLSDIRCVLPTYRYKTNLYNGIIENEYCPVYIAKISGLAKPNPAEVGEYRFMQWDEFKKDVSEHPEQYSYWAREQVVLLDKYVRKYTIKK